MVYETAIDERHSPLRSVTYTLLVLATGVFLGIMLAELRDLAMDSDARAAFETQPIAGEDWHGNVRRSTP